MKLEARPQFAPVLALVLMAFSASPLFGGALYLDGKGSYVSFPATGIPSGGQSFTIEAWINPTIFPLAVRTAGR